MRAACLLLAFAAAACSAAHAQTRWPDYMPALTRAPSESPVAAQLPAGISITPPDPSLPEARRRWGGLWHGWACFANQCDVKLAVESVDADGAALAYAGASRQQHVSERGRGMFNGDELQVTLSGGARLAMRLRADGDMEMTLWHASGELMAAGVLSQAPPAYTRIVGWVPTPFIENGEPVRLEMVEYRPAGAGPFPTVILNHGSTGRGDRPERFRNTFGAPELGRFLAERGWQVLLPQRRGRGASGGLYDEGFEPDRSRYSCRAELSLPGAQRAMADLDTVMAHLLTRADVDRQRLVIGGISRGGILSAAYAGKHPQQFLGVLNFVGGWLSENCDPGGASQALFRQAAAYPRPMLWLYGDNDPFYSLRFSRSNFDAFTQAGGRGRFVSYDVPRGGDGGHGIHRQPRLWSADVDAYLRSLHPQ